MVRTSATIPKLNDYMKTIMDPEWHEPVRLRGRMV